MANKVLITSIRSEGNPQHGQTHRSSGNFSTEFNFSGYSNLYWEVSNCENPDSIKFDIMRDKSAATDPVIFSNLINGSITNIEQYRSLYVANPKGSSGGDFQVSVYAYNQ